MSNNSSDQARKKLYDEYEDSLFRLVMNDVAEKEGKLLLEEKEKLKNEPEYVAFPELIRKFSNQLNTYFKEHKSTNRRHTFKTLNRVAVAMLAVFLVFSAAMLTVQAFRIDVMNFLISIEPKYTSFQLNDNESDRSKSLVVNWTNAYVPTYIPKGYEVDSTSYSDSLKKLAFNNKQDETLFIVYSEYDSSNNVEIDTENASLVKTVKINGHHGTLVVKNSIVTVAWEIDNHMFTVQTQVGVDETIKIAEKVKFIK
jgi:hypothetical protein